MCTRRCDTKVKMNGLFVLVNAIIDKSLRWKQYRMQIGGLKFCSRPDNTHAKFKTILSSFPNLLLNMLFSLNTTPAVAVGWN